MATRLGENIDIFYTDKNNYIHKYYVSESTQWKYVGG